MTTVRYYAKASVCDNHDTTIEMIPPINDFVLYPNMDMDCLNAITWVIFGGMSMAIKSNPNVLKHSRMDDIPIYTVFSNEIFVGICIKDIDNCPIFYKGMIFPSNKVFTMHKHCIMKAKLWSFKNTPKRVSNTLYYRITRSPALNPIHEIFQFCLN
jgi:hypothetical protein